MTMQGIGLILKQVLWMQKCQHYLFLMIWDNAADKVRISVPQCCHELGQLFLVQLSHCAKHPLTGFKCTWHL